MWRGRGCFWKRVSVKKNTDIKELVVISGFIFMVCFYVSVSSRSLQGWCIKIRVSPPHTEEMKPGCSFSLSCRVMGWASVATRPGRCWLAEKCHMRLNGTVCSMSWRETMNEETSLNGRSLKPHSEWGGGQHSQGFQERSQQGAKVFISHKHSEEIIKSETDLKQQGWFDNIEKNMIKELNWFWVCP